MRMTNITMGLSMAISIAGPARADDLDRQLAFLGFRVGDRCSVIVAAMGEPASKSIGSTLGVKHSRLRWTEGPQSYGITCVVNRLVSKRICQSQPDC